MRPAPMSLDESVKIFRVSYEKIVLGLPLFYRTALLIQHSLRSNSESNRSDFLSLLWEHLNKRRSKQTQNKCRPAFDGAVFSTMRLLVLIFVYFLKSSCRAVEISDTSNISSDFGANRTSTTQNSGAGANISSIYLSPFGNTSLRERNERLNFTIQNSPNNIQNCCSDGAVDHNVTLSKSVPNGKLSDELFKQASNHNSTTVKSLSGPSKLNVTLAINLANSTGQIDGNAMNLLSSDVATPKNGSYSAKPELLPSKRSQSDLTKFISEEKLHSVLNHQTSQIVKKVTAKAESESSSSLRTRKGNPTLKQPVESISNESAGAKVFNPSVETGSFVSSENADETQQHLELVRDFSPESGDGKIPVGTDSENREKALNLHSSTIPLQMISNPTYENKTAGRVPGMSWLDVITSPFAKKTMKYFVTDFYPKKILDTVAKRWKPSNSTGNGTRSQEINLTPSVVYPLVVEGVSILVNRLTDDGSNLNEQNESESVLKGRIVLGVIESLNKILKPNAEKTQNTLEISNPSTDVTNHLETGSLSKDILNSGTLNQLLPLVEKVPLGDLQNAINGLIGVINNTTSLHRTSNSGIDLTGILSQPEVLSAMLQNGPKLSGLSGFQNGTALAEIVKKPSVLSSILGNRSNSSDLGNLTSIMNHFLPKNGGGDGVSPKNPLLRSDFASKILAKSPIAHLGALDENIKRLITNSLEKAVSRVKINEKGEIRINEGMKKILGKMIDSDKTSGLNRTSDSLMDVLKSAVASGSVKVEPSSPPEDGVPIVRRNVTRHSPLHRKFQEKYGKYYQKSSVEPFGNPHFVLIVLPIVITVFFA